jgi:hypothetical protein
MRYTSIKDERESDSNGFSSSHSLTKQGNVMKRLLVMLLMTICLVFAGAQSTPIAQAGAGCELVCGESFIDPNDGQCYQMCCPQDKECMRPCETKRCSF